MLSYKNNTKLEKIILSWKKIILTQKKKNNNTRLKSNSKLRKYY